MTEQNFSPSPIQNSDIVKTESMVFGEFPVDQLFADSGEVDPDTGRKLSVKDVLEVEGIEEFGARMLITDATSEAGRQHNSELNQLPRGDAARRNKFLLQVAYVRPMREEDNHLSSHSHAPDRYI